MDFTSFWILIYVTGCDKNIPILNLILHIWFWNLLIVMLKINFNINLTALKAKDTVLIYLSSYLLLAEENKINFVE